MFENYCEACECHHKEAECGTCALRERSKGIPLQRYDVVDYNPKTGMECDEVADIDGMYYQVEDIVDYVERLKEECKLQEHYQKLYHGQFSKAMRCVDRCFQVDGQKEPPILPDFCGVGDDKFEAVVRLATAYRQLKEVSDE